MGSDDRYETTIAKRNMAWVAFQNSTDALFDAIAAGVTAEGLIPFRQLKNSAVHDYEHWALELMRIRTWRKRDDRYQATPATTDPASR